MDGLIVCFVFFLLEKHGKSIRLILLNLPLFTLVLTIILTLVHKKRQETIIVTNAPLSESRVPLYFKSAFFLCGCTYTFDLVLTELGLDNIV